MSKFTDFGYTQAMKSSNKYWTRFLQMKRQSSIMTTVMVRHTLLILVTMMCVLRECHTG